MYVSVLLKFVALYGKSKGNPTHIKRPHAIKKGQIILLELAVNI